MLEKSLHSDRYHRVKKLLCTGSELFYGQEVRCNGEWSTSQPESIINNDGKSNVRPDVISSTQDQVMPGRVVTVHEFELIAVSFCSVSSMMSTVCRSCFPFAQNSVRNSTDDQVFW